MRPTLHAALCCFVCVLACARYERELRFYGSNTAGSTGTLGSDAGMGGSHEFDAGAVGTVVVQGGSAPLASAGEPGRNDAGAGAGGALDDGVTRRRLPGAEIGKVYHADLNDFSDLDGPATWSLKAEASLVPGLSLSPAGAPTQVDQPDFGDVFNLSYQP